MVSVSPPVSPSVVAAILTIQKMSVTCGTLLALCSVIMLPTIKASMPKGQTMSVRRPFMEIKRLRCRESDGAPEYPTPGRQPMLA